MQKSNRRKKLKRDNFMKKIIEEVGLPPGKNSEGYFTREQLQSLYLWVMQQAETREKLTNEVQNIAERLLTDGKPISTPEPKSIQTARVPSTG